MRKDGRHLGYTSFDKLDVKRCPRSIQCAHFNQWKTRNTKPHPFHAFVTCLWHSSNFWTAEETMWDG